MSNRQDLFKALDQRAKEAAEIMRELTARMAEAQAEAEAIHVESEALLKAAEEAKEAALRANYRRTGRIRFHLGQNKSMYIKTYTPGLSKADKNLVYVGILQRSCFKNEDLWESTLEKLNRFMEHIFQLGVDYQREIISQGLDPGTGRSPRPYTPKKVQPTSNTPPPIQPSLTAAETYQNENIRHDTKADAVGILFNQISLMEQAVITAMYMPSGVTAEKLLAKYEGSQDKIASMALRNKMRGYFSNHPEKEFTVAKGKDILQIYHRDKVRVEEAKAARIAHEQIKVNSEVASG